MEAGRAKLPREAQPPEARLHASPRTAGSPSELIGPSGDDRSDTACIEVTDEACGPRRVPALLVAPRLPAVPAALIPLCCSRSRTSSSPERASLSTGIARGRGPVTILAVSLGCGFAAVASLSLVLALIRDLTLPGLVIGWTLISASVWFVALTGGCHRRAHRGLAPGDRERSVEHARDGRNNYRGRGGEVVVPAAGEHGCHRHALLGGHTRDR